MADDRHLRLAPELGPEPALPDGVVGFPEQPGDSGRRLDRKLESYLDRQLAAEPKAPAKPPALNRDELARAYARLKVKEREREAAQSVAAEAAVESTPAGFYTGEFPGTWLEQKPQRNNNAIAVAVFGTIVVGKLLWNRRQLAQMNRDLLQLENVLGFFNDSASSIVQTAMREAVQNVEPEIRASFAAMLPGMVADYVEKARVRPRHTTEVVERAVPGARGRQGPAGRDAKLTRADVKEIGERLLNELRNNPSRYRGRQGERGEAGSVWIDKPGALPPRPKGILD